MESSACARDEDTRPGLEVAGEPVGLVDYGCDDAEGLAAELEVIADVQVQAKQKVVAYCDGVRAECGLQARCRREIDVTIEGIERGVDRLQRDEDRVGRVRRRGHGEHLGDGGRLDAGAANLIEALLLAGRRLLEHFCGEIGGHDGARAHEQRCAK